jgi:acetylornithine deacetylase/succinyl-diaminopimelate desuccinylase-like protein
MCCLVGESPARDRPAGGEGRSDPSSPDRLRELANAPGNLTVLIYGHYDVQPPEPLEGWHSTLFDPIVCGEYLYDKGQMFVHVKAIESHLLLMGFGLPNDRIHGPNEKFHLANFFRAIETSSLFLAELGASRSERRARTTTVESPPGGRADAAGGERNDY